MTLYKMIVRAPGHEFANGHAVRLEGVSGPEAAAGLNGVVYRVADRTADTFALRQLTGPYVTVPAGTYTGGRVARVSQTWSAAHLAGRRVLALADGREVGPVTVSAAGAVNTGAWSAQVRVGLEFVSRITTMPPEVPTRSGSGRAVVKRVVGAALGLYASGPFRMGPRPDRLDPVPGAAGELFTGMKVLTAFPGGWERDGTICIESGGALPLTVTHINWQLEM